MPTFVTKITGKMNLGKRKKESDESELESVFFQMIS